MRTPSSSFTLGALLVLASFTAVACDKTEKTDATPAPSASAITAATAAPSASAAPSAAPTDTAPAAASASAAPATSASAASSATPGASAKAQTFPTCTPPNCPLQAWMKANTAPAMAAADLPAIATALDKIVKFAPAGYTNWASIAKDGATAASAGKMDGVKAACKSCHDQYKTKYKTEMRGRPIAS